MVSVIVTIIVFGLLIFVHELGHFLMAKKAGVIVNEFAMGMGPKLFSLNRGGTLYSIRLFPIGGFVSMEGEDTDNYTDGSYNSKPVWKRFLIIVAGAVMNIVLGFVMLVAVFATDEQLATNTIAEFKDDAVSNSGGLEVGDEILSVNGTIIFAENDIIFELLNDDDGIIDFRVRRDGEKINVDDVEFTTVQTEEVRELYVDFYVSGEENSVLNTLEYSMKKSLSMARLVWISLAQMVTGQIGFDELSGPVGAGAVLGDAAELGFYYLATLVAFLSINIGVFNLLPLPALDGGRLMFLIIEAIRRKPINPKYEGYVHAVGIVLLLGLMVVITFNDIMNLF